MRELQKNVMGKLEELMAAMTTEELISFMDELYFKFLKNKSHSSTSPALLSAA